MGNRKRNDKGLMGINAKSERKAKQDTRPNTKHTCWQKKGIKKKKKSRKG